MSKRRSYIGAPRVYLTNGKHPGGVWKRMWYVNVDVSADSPRNRWFWTWREAIDYALSLPVPADAKPRKVRQ